MNKLTLTLTVAHRGQVVARLTFTHERADVPQVLRLQYLIPRRRAGSNFVRAVELRQRTKQHHSPRPEQWHNALSWVPADPGRGWTEYLPEYEVQVRRADLWLWADLILPQNRFVLLRYVAGRLPKSCARRLR